MSTRVIPTTAGRLGWSRIGIELKQFFRDRESAVFNFALPMFLLIVFGSVFSGEVADGVTFAQYFLAGMVASGLVYSGFQNLAISIPLERDDGTLKRLRGSPMPPSSYFLGKIGVVVVSAVAQIVLLLVIGVLLFDVTLPATAFQWFTLAWISALGVVMCTLLGIAFSSLPRTGRGASALVTPVILVLQFTSGVFFVFTELPQWIQTFASIFPLKWLCQGMRSVFLPESFAAAEAGGSWQLPEVAAMLLLWTLIGAVLARTTFRWTRSD
jgi:ABC-2 type transport system permease protein